MKASICLATALAIREASACTVPLLSRASPSAAPIASEPRVLISLAPRPNRIIIRLDLLRRRVNRLWPRRGSATALCLNGRHLEIRSRKALNVAISFPTIRGRKFHASWRIARPEPILGPRRKAETCILATSGSSDLGPVLSKRPQNRRLPSPEKDPDCGEKSNSLRCQLASTSATSPAILPGVLDRILLLCPA